MMNASENANPNVCTTPTKMRRTRFSMEARRSNHSSRAGSPMGSPLNTSSDGEWSKFQSELKNVKEQSKLYEGESMSEGSIISEYDSPLRGEEKDIEEQRRSLALMKKNIALNEELKHLYEEQYEMIEYFKYHLVDITRSRITEQAKSKNIPVQDYDTAFILSALDVRRIDPMDLTQTLQDATEALLL